jgi:CheY-like chemotaxis protein
VVDDHPANRDILKQMLRLMGYEADTADDGVEGVAAALRCRYALILMDCNMPRMNGYEATAAIRKAEEGVGYRTPIIAITAYALHYDRERCLAAGMDDHLPKPVGMATIKETLARWIGED